MYIYSELVTKIREDIFVFACKILLSTPVAGHYHFQHKHVKNFCGCCLDILPINISRVGTWTSMNVYQTYIQI